MINLFKNVILLMSAGVFVAQSSETTDPIQYLADNLKVDYELIDSAPQQCPESKTSCYLSSLTLSLPDDFNDTAWVIYFSQLMPIYAVESSEFTIEHLNGDVHRIKPTSSFRGFSANAAKLIRFYTQDSQITRSEFMPNYLVADEDSRHRALVIESTKTRLDPDSQLELQPYLLPFETSKQFNLANDDTPWMGTRYLYQSASRPTAELVPEGLIPTPKWLTVKSEQRLSLVNGINYPSEVLNSKSLGAAIQYLSDLGVPSNDGTGIPLFVKVSEQKEKYILETDSEKISVVGRDAEGVFQGLMSLAGLLKLDDLSVPLVAIKDEPLFEFRGFHLDVARNFHSKQFVLDLIRQMGAFKLNVLHLHLADDEGWRLEINDLPELTNVGGYRCFDLDEDSCLLPQLGAGNDRSSQINGYFSREDYIEILKFAQSHFIEVIPSFDMPGHSRAAIVAMEARYKRLMSNGLTEQAQQYRLVEPEDTTQYSSIQHYRDNTLNVCIPQTYRFIEKVLDEVTLLHKEAGVPFNRYHIGADETAGAWLNSPACQVLKAAEPSITYFNGYFIEKISKLVESKGIEVAAWSDGLGHTNVKRMPAKVQSNVWSKLSESGHATAHRHVGQGWDVVLSIPEVTYFDFPYESHPEERGNHWAARAISERKVFEFMPNNLPAHAEFWRNEKEQSYISDDRTTSLASGKQFVGIQGHLWSEMIRSDRQAEYMIYPRLMALAERAWHQPAWALPYQTNRLYGPSSHYFDADHKVLREQDWQRFAGILGLNALPKLAKLDVFYRIPSVAAMELKDGSLDAFTVLPGFDIQVKETGGQWKTFEKGQSAKNIDAVRAIDSKGRAGRALLIRH